MGVAAAMSLVFENVHTQVVHEYEWARFAGRAHPAHGRTVQAELKRALKAITGQDLKVYAAGRTDAGAHAEGQVVNFETDGRISPHRQRPARITGPHPPAETLARATSRLLPDARLGRARRSVFLATAARNPTRARVTNPQPSLKRLGL